MTERPVKSPDDRVIDIARARHAGRVAPPAAPLPSSGRTMPDDLRGFARDREPDDFRHRMITNILAFIFIAALISAGLWLADSLARMRKNQDCVLSGKRGCTPVEAPINTR